MPQATPPRDFDGKAVLVNGERCQSTFLRSQGTDWPPGPQWKAANAGNVTMMIWMGKQYLGQSDRHDQVSSNLNVNLASLTDDQLERLANGDDLRDVLAERGE